MIWKYADETTQILLTSEVDKFVDPKTPWDDGNVGVMLLRCGLDDVLTKRRENRFFRKTKETHFLQNLAKKCLGYQTWHFEYIFRPI